MSYDIYYDKRFIKVEGGIIPLVQVGNNKGWENINGRDVPEKHWTVMRYPYKEELVFTKEDLIDLYEGQEYVEEEHKSRQGYHDNFSKWLIAGIKSAMTIEEHLKLGNRLQLNYNCGTEWLTAKFNTEKEFWDAVNVIDKLKVKRTNVTFARRDITKPSLGSRTPAEAKEYPGFFAIKDRNDYFQNMTKNRQYFGSKIEEAKKFKSRDAAKAYIEKYSKQWYGDVRIAYAEIPCKL